MTPVKQHRTSKAPSFAAPAVPAGRRHGAARDAVAAAASAGVVEMLESRVLLSTTLDASADTFVRNNEFRTTNYGASPILGVKSASSGDARTGFLTFDVGAIGENVTGATLYVTASLQNPTGGPSTLGVFGVEDTDWVEGNGQWAYRDRSDAPLDTSRRITGHGNGYDRDNAPDDEMTWANQPASDNVAIDTVAVDTDLMRTYALDVTSYVVAARAAGEDQISLALKNPQPGEFFTRVLSREFPGGGPQLVVTDAGNPAPSAAIAAPNVTSAGGDAAQVTVTYSGDGAAAVSVGVDDIVVLDPNGDPVPVTGATVAQQGNAITATYDVAAPGGSFDSADNGVYRVTVARGAVTGTGGASAGALSEFRVAIGDNAPPSVMIEPVAPRDGETTFTFTATYTDDVAIDVATINLNNFEINNRLGTGLGFTRVAVTPDENARTVVATYTTEAPGGPGNSVWRSVHDGDYTITLRENQVRDTAGNGAPRTDRAFTVDLSQSDTAGPAADVTVADVMSPGGTVHTARVDYADDAGIDLTSLGATDVRVSGPGGADLPVTGFSLANGATASTRGVIYTFAAPGGAWDAADNGQYTVSVREGEVLDANGNAAGAAEATFTVDAVGPDRFGPGAVITAEDVTEAGTAAQTITVTYADNVAVDPASLGEDDITVTGPAGELDVTDAAVTGTGSTVTVAYTIAAPQAGGFTGADNGQYAVALVPESVRDTSGNAATEASATFAVDLPAGDPRDPTFSNEAVRFTAQSVATLPDGKILIAGYLGDPAAGDSRAVLERRNADGTLDDTFGQDGQVVSPAGADDAFFSVVVQGANQIVAAGVRADNFVLSRFDASGNADATFGAGGAALADFGGYDAAYGLAVAPDGALVAAGESDGNFAVARFTGGGAPAASVAPGGKQLFGVDADSDGLGVAVQGDGKIVAVGARGSAVAVIRLDASGEADPTFSGDGILLVGGLTASRQDEDTPDHSQAVAIQGDGKIVVSNRTPDGDFGLARVSPTGDLDSTFGDNGLAVAGFEGEADVDAASCSRAPARSWRSAPCSPTAAARRSAPSRSTPTGTSSRASARAAASPSTSPPRRSTASCTSATS